MDSYLTTSRFGLSSGMLPHQSVPLTANRHSIIIHLLKKVFNMNKPEETPTLVLLRAHGYRITEARKAVLAAIGSSEGWLRPEEILTRAKQVYPSIGLVTVYRTLSLLSELDCVRRIHMEDGCHGYALATLEHGHHLICRACHRAIEVPGSEDLQPYLEDVSKSTGYLIEDHVLELVGVCMDCQESPPE